MLSYSNRKTKWPNVFFTKKKILALFCTLFATSINSIKSDYNEDVGFGCLLAYLGSFYIGYISCKENMYFSPSGRFILILK